MKVIKDLVKPSLDAIDYKSKGKKKFFTDAYVATSFLEDACDSNCYYFVGEKGAGKTALAFHMQNSSPRNIDCKLLPISETQYVRFITLKKSGGLAHTDYSVIWRTTLLYLVAKLAVERKKKWVHKLNGKFKAVEEAINHYDSGAHIPELEYVVEFVSNLTQDFRAKAEIPSLVKFDVGEKDSQTEKLTRTKVKEVLLECERLLKDALEGVHFKEDLALFLDGLDAKPNSIDFDEYRNCLIGLSEAAWHLNSEYFSNIRGSEGRMRCVLLLRPDVFDSLNMHNSNCKLSDNAVVFNWNTTNKQHKTSALYKVSDRFFTAQSGSDNGWDKYFSDVKGRGSRSFLSILRKSFHRPRDVFSAIKILIEISIHQGKGDATKFDYNMVDSSRFYDIYSDYLLGEVKNYANYYVTNSEFEGLVSFYQYLNGATEFKYSEFCDAYNIFINLPKNTSLKKIPIVSSAGDFLQFWYDVNVIGYMEPIEGVEGDNHYHWSHRDRSPAKVMPKIREHCNYMVHPGVAKSLDLGRRFRIMSTSDSEL